MNKIIIKKITTSHQFRKLSPISKDLFYYLLLSFNDKYQTDTSIDRLASELDYSQSTITTHLRELYYIGFIDTEINEYFRGRVTAKKNIAIFLNCTINQYYLKLIDESMTLEKINDFDIVPEPPKNLGGGGYSNIIAIEKVFYDKDSYKMTPKRLLERIAKRKDKKLKKQAKRALANKRRKKNKKHNSEVKSGKYITQSQKSENKTFLSHDHDSLNHDINNHESGDNKQSVSQSDSQTKQKILNYLLNLKTLKNSIETRLGKKKQKYLGIGKICSFDESQISKAVDFLSEKGEAGVVWLERIFLISGLLHIKNPNLYFCKAIHDAIKNKSLGYTESQLYKNADSDLSQESSTLDIKTPPKKLPPPKIDPLQERDKRFVELQSQHPDLYKLILTAQKKKGLSDRFVYELAKAELLNHFQNK